MTPHRLLPLLLACGCAPAPPAPAAPPRPAPNVAACAPLLGTLLELHALTTSAEWHEREHDEPRRPVQLAEKLDAEARKARALPITDPDAAGAAREAADILARLAGKVGAFGDARAAGGDAEPALRDLYGALRAARPEVDVLASRCALSTKAPRGRLPPEVIQQIVRARFDVYRACYENALRVDPTLRLRVSMRFVIDRSGTVSEAADADRAPPRPTDWGKPSAASPPADHGVSACVVEAFKQLTFPPPDGGTVTVTYPIQFSPGG